MVLSPWGLWTWLAVMISRGCNWARITLTVLLGLGTVVNLFTLDSATAVPLPLALIDLVLSAVVLVLLWLAPSSRYFQAARLAAG